MSSHSNIYKNQCQSFNFAFLFIQFVEPNLNIALCLILTAKDFSISGYGKQGWKRRRHLQLYTYYYFCPKKKPKTSILGTICIAGVHSRQKPSVLDINKVCRNERTPFSPSDSI